MWVFSVSDCLMISCLSSPLNRFVVVWFSCLSNFGLRAGVMPRRAKVSGAHTQQGSHQFLIIIIEDYETFCVSLCFSTNINIIMLIAGKSYKKYIYSLLDPKTFFNFPFEEEENFATFIYRLENDFESFPLLSHIRHTHTQQTLGRGIVEKKGNLENIESLEHCVQCQLIYTWGKHLRSGKWGRVRKSEREWERNTRQGPTRGCRDLVGSDWSGLEFHEQSNVSK